jgi:hypothetical protein
MVATVATSNGKVVRVKKKNRLPTPLVVLFAPVMIFLWVLGWSLYQSGEPKQTRK